MADTVTCLLEENRLYDVEYVEPYAGGAAIALALLFGEYASIVHINDLSRPVYAFWHAVLNNTGELCHRIERVEINMHEWRRQRAIYDNQDTADLTDLGFATLFLNRTNRSGIIGGGVIGGKDQSGTWLLDARFTKTELIKRIRRISRYRSRIRLYQMDALEFTNQVVAHLGANTFAFYDPPYIEKSENLYLNNYTIESHRQLAMRIAQLEQPWVVTYDHAAIEAKLYQRHRRLIYRLSYSAHNRHKGLEVMFLSNRLALPPTWQPATRIPMKPAGDPYPVYGVLEGAI